MAEDYSRIPRMKSKALRAILYSHLPGNSWREACKTELDFRTARRMAWATYIILIATCIQLILTIIPRNPTNRHSQSLKSIESEKEFEQKIECEKYANEVRSNWKDEENEEAKKFKISANDVAANNEIVRLFYSPKRNSCVCAVRTQWLFPKNSPPEFSYQAYVFDVLTNEQIWSKQYGSDGTNIDKNIQDQLRTLE